MCDCALRIIGVFNRHLRSILLGDAEQMLQRSRVCTDAIRITLSTRRFVFDKSAITRGLNDAFTRELIGYEDKRMINGRLLLISGLL